MLSSLKDNKRAYLLGFLILIVSATLVFVSLEDNANEASVANSSSDEIKRTSVSILDAESFDEKDALITVSGKVEGNESSVISTQTSGVVAQTPVELGDSVKKGQTLILLENSDQKASLRQAKANLSQKQARLQELKNGARPEEIRNAQSQLRSAKSDFEAASSNLLNTDLQAYVSEGNQAARSGSLDKPQITGTYDHDESGEYRITLFSSGSKSGYSFEYEGLENGIGTVRTDSPEPLGNRGLYIEFPENFASNKLLEWVVPIPNKRSRQYTSVKNNLQQTQSRLQEARNNLELTKSGPRSEQITAQEAQVESAAASVESAQSQLDKTIIEAPFAGEVQSINVDPGAYVSVGQPVARVVNASSLKATAFVNADIANKLSVGDTATTQGGAEARVTGIAPGVDSSSGNVEIEMRIDAKETNVTPGSYVDISLPASEKGMSRRTQKTLPLSAVNTTSNGDFVFVVGEDNKLKQVSVSAGDVTGDGVRISGQLPDKPIVSDTSGLSSGQTVTIESNNE